MRRTASRRPYSPRIAAGRGACLLLAVAALLALPGAAAAQDQPPSDRFDVTLLEGTITQGTRIAVAPDGRVLLAERDGRLKIWKPDTKTTVLAGTLPTAAPGELGFMGLALSPDFATTGYVYAHFVPTTPSYNTTRISRISRFKLTGDTLDLASQVPIYNVQHPSYAGGGHSAGDLEFAPNGDLYFSTGDNTNCCNSFGYPPMDERPNQISNDAQTTAANTNNPNGKVLRIHPLATPGAVVGEGTTYTIPAGNLFDEALDTNNKTLPEIYAMGLRNPFTIGNAKSNGEVWFADFGPDATLADPTRGPAGHVSMIRATQPGNYGWPYCYVPGYPYADWDYVANVSRGYYDCDNLVNNSPNNLTPPANNFVNGGLLDIPDATKRTLWWTYSTNSPTSPFSDLFGGGAMAGPLYQYDPANPSPTKFPAWFDGRYFFFEWTTDWVQTVAFNGDGSVKDRAFFLPTHTFIKPMDMKFGPDGALYVLAYGNGWGTNNDDTGLYRVDYAAGNRTPIIKATTDKDSGGSPLTVAFDARQTSDPDAGDTLTYSWDFENDGTPDATGPTASHVYSTPGAVTARLTVTDSHGASAVRNFPLVVGNTRPVVKIVSPANGTPVEIGTPVTYRVSVTDTEDAAVDCTKVELQVSLGHNEHAHPDQIVHPGADCTGTVTPNRTSGHTGTLYVFTVFEASYTDAGNGAAPALTGFDSGVYNPHVQATSVYPIGEGTGLYTGATFMQGPGHWLMFRNYDLAQVGAITMSISSRGGGGTMQIRADSPTGPLIGSAVMPNTNPAQSLQRVYQTQTALLTNKPAGAHDLYFVTAWTDPAAHAATDTFPEIFFQTYTLIEPPAVSLTLNPAVPTGSNGWYKAAVQFTMASTGFSTATRQYSLDGGALANYTTAVTVSAQGAHTVTYQGTNPAGTSTPQTAAIKIDGTAPVTAAAYAPAVEASGWYSRAPKITLAATDNASGVALTEYLLDGGPWTAYTAPFEVGGFGPHSLAYRSTDQAGNVEAAKQASFLVSATSVPGSAGGSVPATLALTLGSPAAFGAFTPGLAKDYTATMTANVISTAGDGTLSVADPSSTATGRLVNGAFALPSVLQAKATSAGGTGGAYANVGGSAAPTTLLSYALPTANDAVTVSFQQHIGATDALRTGAYSKTLTFTLSTTTP